MRLGMAENGISWHCAMRRNYDPDIARRNASGRGCAQAIAMVFSAAAPSALIVSRKPALIWCDWLPAMRPGMRSMAEFCFVCPCSRCDRVLVAELTLTHQLRW